ncbi:MAG: response regulator, partial [Fibrobacter sp.]|nr:response regulator [Fibrobacter sp.]
PCRVSGFAVFNFEISDNGHGMSKEFLEHIYDEFAREQSSTQSGVPGTGLGMSIVKRLVDMMGGEIDVQSEIGLGTTVHVRTQFKIVSESDVSLENVETCSLENAEFLKGKRVLLVEDNEFNREVAQDFLHDAEMVVECAENGLEAVTKVSEQPAGYYDCILMDVQMPVMDGYEAAMAIRKLYPSSKLPIVALSANAFEEDRQKSMASGMDAHLEKPFVAAKVLGTMSSLMQRKVNVS